MTPAHRKSFVAEWQRAADAADAAAAVRFSTTLERYNCRAHDLPTLQVGSQVVAVQDAATRRWAAMASSWKSALIGATISGSQAAAS